MPKINQEIQSFARIMVIGIGGSGKNAVNHMINSKVKGVSFICMNTDTQDLHHSLAEKKIHIGKNLTKGLGAGMDPEVGKKAAEETKSEIQDVIKEAKIVGFRNKREFTTEDIVAAAAKIIPQIKTAPEEIEAIRRWGELKLPIQIVPLPTYASWCNPIEKLWRKLRQDVTHLHRWADDLEVLRIEIDRFLDQFAQGSLELLRYVGLAVPD